ncbi:MAG: DJ-1/PfpI family protein [Campylobacteraceae bacterium]|jgi:putative intracellular protease/amidase|nr:DJ-1/PfpI family protein [Campylobacteraceae bacterium]
MNVGVLLFDDFETLDAFGPVEVFGKVDEFDLHYISLRGGIVKSAGEMKIYTISAKEIYFDVVLIPGGKGTRVLVDDENFIRNLFEICNKSHYCLSVCTGSALLAKTGLLDGKEATTNKKAFEWVASQNSHVSWVKSARWTVSGKFYTSSGVSAGIDMALGFVADIFGIQKAMQIAKHIEYVWNTDKAHDPFCL